MTFSSRLTQLTLLALIILSASLVLWGCGSEEALGAGIPADQPVVSLTNVLEAPEKYNEKSFVVKGTVSSQCSMLCDFVLTEGSDSATIYAQDFKFPKLALNKPVTVYVQATVGEQLILSALGMKL